MKWTGAKLSRMTQADPLLSGRAAVLTEMVDFI